MAPVINPGWWIPAIAVLMAGAALLGLAVLGAGWAFRAVRKAWRRR